MFTKKAASAALLLALTLTANANADESSTGTTGLYVDFGANQYLFDTDTDADADPSAYFGLGYQFSDHWAAALKYSSTDINLDIAPNFDLSYKFYDLSAIYRYQPRSESSFYWKFGLGEQEVEGDSVSGTSYQLGAGYNAAINQNLSFNIGLDFIFTDDENTTDAVPYLGLTYFFGGQAAQPAPAPAKPEKPMPPKPKDSDRDGVFDEMDQCPATAAGIAVDKAGCELDSDNDGIVDSKDACPETPAGAKVDGKGCRIMLTEEVSITLNVKFANNSNAIGDAYSDEIKRVADFMRQYPDTQAQIQGFTDSTGSATYNQKLSQKRAAAVRQYLIDNFSISAGRLTAIGKGEADPVADNSTKEGRAQNRRVEAKLKTLVKKAQ